MNAGISPEPAVLLEIHGHVGLVLLNRPDHRNALCADLVEGVLAALEESRAKGARAIVIGSRGTAFCAGADIHEALHSGWLLQDAGASGRATPLDLFQALEADDRPVIAAVNGLALGGGVELVLSCDLALASEAAKFALPEISLGVIPNTGIARLPQIVGQRKALELMLMRRRIDAREAHALGLVNDVCAAEALTERAIAMADAICSACPPGAIAAVKHGVRGESDWPRIRALLATMREPEWREGFSSFFEKRSPDYSRFWSA
jgi:enoyl-CoA hydratase/carnithine racemase